MNLDFDESEVAFRAEVRDFLEKNLPADIQQRVRSHAELSKSDTVRWQQILHQRGWGASMWPKQAGGTGWNATQRYIFEEECVNAFAPPQLPFGLVMVAPVIMAFGSPEQQRTFLPRILSGEDWWCQGYSEPGSGSDLASLRMRAERDGDHYVVNGQKTWTTLAQHADWIFCLVRTSTDARQQDGISFLLINMHSPGVSVRPIIMMDGGHEINDVFFDNVRVPVGNLVGEENKGWSYAKFLLVHERTGLALVPQGKRLLSELKEMAAEAMKADCRLRDRVARLEIELAVHEMTMLRVVSASGSKRGPGAEAAILKIRGTEIFQNITETILQLAGGSYVDPAVANRYFNMRKLSIFGGSNEIQKNIIAQMVLGL
jgi:alkylation response protein AidB-like acyl-CoA dehydrogenase